MHEKKKELDPIALLATIAREAMAERGFVINASQEVSEEMARIIGPAHAGILTRDLSKYPFVSIDNEESRDLDQVTYAEKVSSKKDRLFVAIADVDALVSKNGAIDRQAFHNTTSVYTPAQIFPMLPLKLSNDLTSLNEGEDRSAMVVQIIVDEEGRFDLEELYFATVRNRAKLSFRQVATWLTETSDASALHYQLKLQDQIAQRLKEHRTKQGALLLKPIEAESVMEEGQIVRIVERKENRAHQLIENVMIVTNVCVTRFLMEHHRPLLRRVVRTPKRWSRIVQIAEEKGGHLPHDPDVRALQQFLLHQYSIDPLHFADLSLLVIKLLGRGEYVVGTKENPLLGHFDLALRDYAHATAPNRRFPDLVMQRLVKSALSQTQAPYSLEELRKIASHCTEKEDDALKVERRLIKCAAAITLVHKVGERFAAIVTGASPKGTWVRLIDPPVEGRLTHGFEGLDVGDEIVVQLIRVDIHNGHIDFKR